MPQAFSYHARRAEEELNTGRAQPRDQDIRRREHLVRYWRQRLGMLIALIVIVVCLFNVLLLTSDPRIVPLTDNSTTASFLHSNATYEHAAQILFNSSLLNGNKITVNTAEVVKQLEAEFPELSDASVTLPLIGHRPIVYISPATPTLMLVTNTQQSFIIDQNGKALIEANKLASVGDLKLPTVNDQSGIVVKPDEVVLPSANISFIQTIGQQLTAQHFTVSSYVLPAAANELDVHLQGQPYFVKFNMYTNDAKQQAGTFIATAQYLSSKQVTPGQYIDVRVDGRAYYK